MMASLINRLNTLIHDPQWLASIGHSSWPYPPTTLAVVRAREAELGFRLPDLLRDIYTQVGNGGLRFPYCISSLAGGVPAYHDGRRAYDLVEYYYLRRGRQPLSELQHDFEAFPEFSLGYKQWFDKLLPISSGGCTYVYLLDCSKSSVPVLLLDDAGGALSLENPSLAAWLEEWLDSEMGKLYRLDDELKQLIQQGKTISAIITYQRRTRCRLQEARAYIEDLKE